jgi:hypothetical protein
LLNIKEASGKMYAGAACSRAAPLVLAPAAAFARGAPLVLAAHTCGTELINMHER